MKTFREFVEDKMDKVDVQATLNGRPKEWIDIVSRFPEQLQREILDERPNPTKEDMEWIGSWKVGPQPTTVDLKSLLGNLDNLNSIARCPPEVVKEINEKWGLNVTPGRSYDSNPARYEQYRRMQGSTAKPSVMVDGEIAFGVGRFIAALMRGDRQMRVWDIRTA